MPAPAPSWTLKGVSLTRKEASLLQSWGCPREVLHALDFVAQNAGPEESSRDVEVLDMFCGEKAISGHWSKRGKKASDSKFFCFWLFALGARAVCQVCVYVWQSGFLTLLLMVLQMAPDALGVIGLPCITYIFMNSFTHGRTSDKPYGNESTREYVKLANVLTVRTVIVIMIMSVRAVYWFVEQPGSSKVIHFPELKHLQKLIWASGMKTYFQRFWMGSWGAPSPKLSMGISSMPYIDELKTKLTQFERAKLSSKGIAIVKVLPCGKKTVSGGPALRKTQIYPSGFASKLYDLISKVKAFIVLVGAVQSYGIKNKFTRTWDHLNLNGEKLWSRISPTGRFDGHCCLGKKYCRSKSVSCAKFALAGQTWLRA
ncbi:unnamed protein product [Cladocopium goreaui]|uniref:Rhamnose biosynthetic enzyme 1 n=1 Tax=Cladocopium goreaui TaxID=2562237 RepID=A0A9P1CHR8_9DINO|nr:unnamed protein product [Cladocopium goreaui]